MKSTKVQFVTATILAAILLLSPLTATLAATSEQAVMENKNEIIYATLAANGAIKGVYAVNQFSLSSAGSVTDFGHYESAVNLTNTDPLIVDSDRVSFTADAGNFYYQGNMGAAKLPWSFSVGYSLDGVVMPPEQLSGKSGNLQITLTSRHNADADPVFNEHYMLQVTVTLDTELSSQISAPDATIASAGANTVIVYTVLPKKDANIHISAQIKNFTMKGIEISALPFSMNVDVPDTDDMIDDFRSLADAIDDLNDGVGELADGALDLQSGANKLSDSSIKIFDGLRDLSKNSDKLSSGSAKIRSALNEIDDSLNNSSSSELDLTALSQLPPTLTQLAQGLNGISGGLTELNTNFQTAYGALDSAMQGIPASSISQDELQALYAQTNPSEYALLDQLTGYYGAALTAKGTYDQVKPAFEAVGPTLEALAGSIDTISGALSSMSAQIAQSLTGMDMLSQLEELKEGMSELADNYSEFHRGLLAYFNGVDELASGYEDFDSGISDFSGGVGKLKDGIDELYDGTKELNDEVSDMPDEVQTKIDDMLDDYTSTEFDPVSFTSAENLHTGKVQFVCKLDGITKLEKTEEAEPPVRQNTIWDRFIALFRAKEE